VQLQEAVDDAEANLHKARIAGDHTRVTALEKELAGRQALLENAHKTLQAARRLSSS
jgi:hypothetical protein